MRFLMLNWRDRRSPLAGGAERVTLAFLRGLRERGHEVDWFTFGFPGGASRDEVDGIGIHRAGGVGSSMVGDAVVPAAAAEIQPGDRPASWDSLVQPWWWSDAVPGLHPRGAGTDLGFVLPMAHLECRSVGRSDGRAGVIGGSPWVPSESTREALIRRGVREVRVLPNGVDLEPLGGAGAGAGLGGRRRGLRSPGWRRTSGWTTRSGA